MPPRARRRFLVQVSVRERPLLEGEGAERCDAVGLWPGTFLSPGITQAEAAQRAGIFELAESFVEGIDCTVLAYGQTGSGKTHSMLGPPGALAQTPSVDQGLPEDWGIYPRAMASVMDRIRAIPTARLRIWAVEVYLENVFDLLNQKAPVQAVGGKRRSGRASSGFSYMQNSHAQYDADGKWIPPYLNGSENPALRPPAAVSGQYEEEIHSLADVIRIGRIVEVTRAAKGHALNDRSSRSHAIFGAVLTVVGRTSHWLFVDLAGSERVAKSEVAGLRMTEAVSTNKSLSALQRVVVALANHDDFVPYRDHTLTQMLSQSLGGTSRTAVVVTVSGSAAHSDETQNSIRFAKAYLRVTTHAEVAAAVDPAVTSGALQQAERELAELAKTHHAGGVDPGASAAARRSWEHNLQQLNHYRDQATAAKQRLQERVSVQENASVQQRLAFAEAKVTLHEGVVARMIFSGLFKNPSPLLVAKQREVAQLRQTLRDATGQPPPGVAEGALPGGEVVLGHGLAGMIKHIRASHVQG